MDDIYSIILFFIALIFLSLFGYFYLIQLQKSFNKTTAIGGLIIKPPPDAFKTLDDFINF